MTSNEGYLYKESEAVIGDKFVGLALDENNQDDLKLLIQYSLGLKKLQKNFIKIKNSQLINFKREFFYYNFSNSLIFFNLLYYFL